ncbi:hypothetical protein [uncultured Cellulomonas sp.]|uniref:hypothetical protein n=1 Tax=uncultured Cellulomonas sp. TaxID=189682 RepID=UPI0028E62AEE|nr:hypothetical protein [uncultured Cellulomonas sp.]
MRTDLRTATACASLIVGAALLVGCQSATVGSPVQETAPPVPTPVVSSEEPAPSPEPDDGTTADPSQMLVGLTPGSDACREAYAQQLLAADPAYFDVRPVDDPITLLTYDRLTETITADEHARWGMERLLHPDDVPQEYRLPDLTGEGTDPLTGIALASMWETDCLPLETQQWLTDYMTPTVVVDEP